MQHDRRSSHRPLGAGYEMKILNDLVQHPVPTVPLHMECAKLGIAALHSKNRLQREDFTVYQI